MIKPLAFSSRHRRQLMIALVFLLVPLFAAAQDEPVPDSAAVPVDSLTQVPEGATPAPVSDLMAQDTPNDDGGSILLTWSRSPDDSQEQGKVSKYLIYRAADASGVPGEFELLGEVPRGTLSFSDGNAADDLSYHYKVVTVNEARFNGALLWEARGESMVVGPIKATAQWFHMGRINIFIAVLMLSVLIIWFINQAKAGKKLFIRKIAGLEAVDEAVGRATEMGRKIYYIPGTQDMDNVQTIAGVSILGRVAELAAQYETYLEVPVARSLVLVTAKEVVKEAYSKVGRPDAFQEDQVHYLTDDQFGYAAGIDGMVVREKPATIFYMGAFYAESLILAETGNSIGAIQIAGTGMPMQLPFFVAACDYTLIGEELFAASAYLSQEPKMLGSLKGQDMGKALALISILVGLILETFGIFDFSRLFSIN